MTLLLELCRSPMIERQVLPALGAASALVRNRPQPVPDRHALSVPAGSTARSHRPTEPWCARKSVQVLRPPPRCCSDIDLDRRRRRDLLHHRPERLGQVHAAALHQRAGDRRPRRTAGQRRGSRLRRDDTDCYRRCQPRRLRCQRSTHRHGLPAVQPVPEHDGRRERHVGAGTGQEDVEGRSAAEQAARLLASVGLAGHETTLSRDSSPVDSSSASRSPGRWPWNPASCSSTSRPARWTRSASARCSRSCSDLASKGMTMLVVTHEMGFAREVADRRALHGRGLRRSSAATRAKCCPTPGNRRTRLFLEKVL